MLHYFLGRSFPYAIGINFRDDKKQSLEMLVVRDNKFREPKGGWLKEGREYMVVENESDMSIGKKLCRLFRNLLLCH